MKACFFISMALFVCNSVLSQTKIRGRVSTAEQSNYVDNVSVILQEKGKTAIKSFTTTDKKGLYELIYNGQSDSIIVSVSGFNIKKQLRYLANKSQEVNFAVEEEVIKLKEVSITPPKIRQRGDTLDYNVNSFLDVNDRSIGDVLKKMPGIQVAESGQIYYQNKAINKFYIEDMDMLQGKYGIATNNVQAKDVATVQVLENHQPIKALKDSEMSEDAAINLKLKDSAKGVFMANAQLGVGASSSLLLSNELIGMEFSKNRQKMMVYKGDNSGRSILQELSSFYGGVDRRMQQKLLYVQKPSSPSVSQQRYLYNDSHMGTINDLRKLKKNYSLTSNVNYSFDKDRRNSISYTDYYLPGDSILSISEIASSRMYKNILNGSTQLEKNTDILYLNNKLSFGGEWERESGDNFAADSIFQFLRNPSFNISNSFDLTKRNEEKILKFHSTISYRDLSQRLAVAPILYADLFNLSSVEGQMQQKADMKNFYTLNSVSWGTKLGVNLNFKLSFMADLQDLQSELSSISTTSAISQTADSLSNNLKWNIYEWNLAPSLWYTFFKKVRVSVYPKLRYTILAENNKLRANTINHHYLFFDPYVSLNYSISPMWDVMSNYSFTNNISTINDVYTGYLMSSYRRLSKNDGEINKKNIHVLSFRLNHKNPLTTLFSSFNINYVNTRSSMLNEYEYNGVLSMKSSVIHPNTSHSLSTSASVGKDITFLTSKISLNGGYGYNRGTQVSQGRVGDYESQYISITPSFVARLGVYANFDYKLNYRSSWGKAENSSNRFPTINSLSNKASMNIFLIKGMIAILSCENFYNSVVESGSRWMWFGDFALRYKWKEMDFMIDYTNIFNTKRYISTSYSGIGRYAYSYNLRPAEILFRIRLKLK